MDWAPDNALLTTLTEIIDNAFKNPTPAVNQALIEAANNLNSRPDGLLYLIEIFKNINLDVSIRNSAGFLIKNRILLDKPHRTAEGIVSAVDPVTDVVLMQVAAVVIDGLSDEQEPIRRTSGSILSSLLLTWPASKFQSILSQIHANCDSNSVSYFIREASWGAAVKILEDVLDRCAEAMSSCEDIINQFARGMLYSGIKYCSQGANIAQCEYKAVALALGACNKITSRADYLEDGLLDASSKNYLTALGACAEIHDVEVQIEVLRGMAALLDYHPRIILDGEFTKAISNYLTKATAHDQYRVRYESILVWPKITSHSPAMIFPFLEDNLGNLCVNLLKNMKYSDEDFCQMDPSQFVEDDAATPDDLTQIAPQFHNERTRGGHDDANIGDDDDDDDDEEAGANTWGTDWTLRKGSALTLDQLSTVYGDEILPFVLPVIESNLQSSEWQIIEAAVLALGAFGPNCLGGLVAHLPSVLNLLEGIARHRIPLVRSISVWCMGRLRCWYQDYRVDDKYSQSVVKTILLDCLDRNKTVQQAAISAVAFVCEGPTEKLLPQLSDIGKTFSTALSMYQERNLMMLFDTINSMTMKLSDVLGEDPEFMRFFLKMTEMFCTMIIERPSFPVLAEAVAVLFAYVGDNYLVQCYDVVFNRCSRIVIELTSAILNYPDVGESADEASFPLVRSDVIVTSMDIITSVLLSMKDRTPEEVSRLISAESDLLPAIVQLCIRDIVKKYHYTIRTTVFALVGDFAGFDNLMDPTSVTALLPELIQSVNCHIISHSGGSVLNYDPNKIAAAQNAIWAIGEITLAESYKPLLQNYLQDLMSEFAKGITVNSRNVMNLGAGSREKLSHLSLIINIIQATLRLGRHYPREVGDLMISTNLDISTVMRTLGTTKLEYHYIEAIEGWMNICMHHAIIGQRDVQHTIEMIALSITGRGNDEGSPLTEQALIHLMMKFVECLVNKYPQALKNGISESTPAMQQLIASVLTEDQKNKLTAA